MNTIATQYLTANRLMIDYSLLTTTELCRAASETASHQGHRRRAYMSAGLIILLLIIGENSMGELEPPSRVAVPLDPAGTWVETPWGEPVIDRGEAGEWDHYAVDNPYVHPEGGKFYCFFEAQDKPFSQGGHEAFGLAVSSDGRRWEKLADNPILNVGEAEAWDSVVAKLPAGVIKRNGLYHLFYSGLDKSTKQIGLATARRLTGPWTKAADNPVLESRSGQWDAFLSTYPAPVFEIEGNYYLLFRGMETRYRRQGAGLAMSTDLRHWRRFMDRPVIPVAEEMASLALTTVGGRYVGISQPTDLRGRRYWFSVDLKEWQKGPAVNFRASVQAETLSNPFLANGRWTVLYEQKDRIYRAVLQPPQ